jgi:polar amino acid transport system substrate-binding protein
MKKIAIALAVALSASAHAAQFKIAGYPIPLMIENANSGLFVEIVKELISRTGQDFEVVVYPAPRTVASFHAGEIDAFFPALDVLIETDKAATEPMYVKKDFAFTRTGEPEIRSIQELAGKKVGITAGYPYVKELTANPAITLDVGPNDLANAAKLSAGRIDVFVVEEKTGLAALAQSGVDNVTYPADSPISEQNVYIAFQATEVGKAQAEAFSKALLEMQQDGTFGKIMQRAQ